MIPDKNVVVFLADPIKQILYIFVVGFTPIVFCSVTNMIAELNTRYPPIVCTIQAFPLPITTWEKKNDGGHGFLHRVHTARLAQGSAYHIANLTVMFY